VIQRQVPPEVWSSGVLQVVQQLRSSVTVAQNVPSSIDNFSSLEITCFMEPENSSPYSQKTRHLILFLCS
jgi:hypothetical protein